MGLIIKDAYVKGLHPSLQLELKSLEKYATANVKDLVQENQPVGISWPSTYFKHSSEGLY